jgi:signal transduction histidine kinase
VKLLENAVKYSADGDIQLEIARDEHDGQAVAVLSVREPGQGPRQHLLPAATARRCARALSRRRGLTLRAGA